VKLPSPPCKDCISLPICAAQFRSYPYHDLITESEFIEDVSKRCEFMEACLKEIKSYRITAFYITMVCKHFNYIINNL
jgi:hypothetical protein